MEKIALSYVIPGSYFWSRPPEENETAMTSTATAFRTNPAKDVEVDDVCDDAAYCFYCDGPETD
ncbi:hypothetical protein QFZ33_004729 [Arthrobacter globiformis]|nr:hypothetical protein [Arthrobacter globiformis]